MLKSEANLVASQSAPITTAIEAAASAIKEKLATAML